MGYVILGFRVPTTSYPSNLPHLCPPTMGGAKVVKGSKVARGVGGYVILRFRVPTTSASNICALTPMYPPNIVCLHPPSLQSSRTCALPPRGKGSEGEQGWWEEHGVCYTLTPSLLPLPQFTPSLPDWDTSGHAAHSPCPSSLPSLLAHSPHPSLLPSLPCGRKNFDDHI